MLVAINENVGFLHGGEGEAARRRYSEADAATRRDLIEFLNSL